MTARHLPAALLGGLVGFAAALVFGWATWVQPLRATLDARERSSLEWERLARAEREALGAVRAATVDELRGWVAAVDEQARRFAELERLVRQQERQLDAPVRSALALATLAVLGVLALVVAWVRDANAAAATTLAHLADLAPGPPPIGRETTVVAGPPAPACAGPEGLSLPPPRTHLECAASPLVGTVARYFARRGYGWLVGPDGAELFFHVDQVPPADRELLDVGLRVVYFPGRDRDGRPAALGVRVAPGD